mmetsp:Transcript_37760/g.87275  ORF Transcript_37760/g.87275 Transcript_37760/m.87275 type:complete len:224 (-) Transcript_37760:123-794(-)
MSGGFTAPQPIAKAIEALRLPEVRPAQPLDNEELNSLRGALERARAGKDGVLSGAIHGCRSSSSSTTASTGVARGCRRSDDRLVAAKRRSPEDFLLADAQRPCRPERQRASRPTQRQAIDDETAVPVEVFESMLALGRAARVRATHSISFEEPSGRPYLRHHDADALREARAAELTAVKAAAMSIVSVPSRPPSSCATEYAEEHAALSRWSPLHTAHAVQVES